MISAVSMLTVLLPLALASCSVLGITGPDQSEPRPGDLTVLFIGSSYFNVNDMPGILDRFATEGGHQVYVEREVLSGQYLDYFAWNAHAAEVIRKRDWDYVILQGGCQNAAYPQTAAHEVYPALQELKRKIEENHSGTRTVYMMPWAFEDGMIWVEGQTDTYSDMQIKIRDNAIRWAESLDLVLAPVGMAWYEILSGDPPLHYLHLADWNHPSWRGSYLSAAVISETLFAESAMEVGYRGGLALDEANHFKEVASWTVLDSLDLWNVSGH